MEKQREDVEPARTLEPPSSREEILFAEALELPPDERASFVRRAAGEDRALAERVASLVAAHATAGAFLEQPAAAPAAPGHVAEIGEGPGARIGPYELVRVLGEGGFGIVYLARQTEPVRRDVALKIIKLGMDTRQVIARFEAERQALAVLDHPYIARVFDAGATSTGRPYFVMELVEGEDVASYCDRRRLDAKARIRLFVDVCGALHHAHQRGLIHRDLKPSNILVSSRDGKHVPKVIDFGIAKATKQRMTERTLLTEMGQFIGTPVYMSPEQAERGDADIDVRSDIYSLGVVAYELLTGSTPFTTADIRDRGLAEIQTFIKEHEPPAPSARVTKLGDAAGTIAASRGAERQELSSQLRGDLDWIVLKALEKDRERRYESAAALSQDLERYLAHLPVSAGPPSKLYHARKFVRRHRLAVGSGAIVLLAVVAGVVLMSIGFFEARRNAEIAKQQRDLLSDVLLMSSGDGTARLDSGADDALEAEVVRLFGADHPAVAGTIRSRAERLDSDSRFDEAADMYARALEATTRIYGRESRAHAALLTQAGRMNARIGRAADARAMFETALSIEEGAYGGRSYRLNGARLALADLLSDGSETDEALALLRDAKDLIAEQAPNDLSGRLVALQAYLTRLLPTARTAEAGDTFAEIVSTVDRTHPGATAARGDVRLQLAAWDRQARHFAPEAIERYLRDALAVYRAMPATTPVKLAQAQSLLAETRIGQGTPESIEEGLALLDEMLTALREPYAGTSALADLLDAHALRLEEHKRHGAAIRATLEVIELRRALNGAEAEVQRHTIALERLATAIASARAADRRPNDIRAALDAVAFLKRELPSSYEVPRRLEDVLQILDGNPLSVLKRVSGAGKIAEGAPRHPHDLATAAFAVYLYGNRQHALSLLQEAIELARLPQFSSDRQTQEWVELTRKSIGAPADFAAPANAPKRDE